MEEVYRKNYSVYILAGAQLKIPYSGSKRVKIYELEEALIAASRVANRYRGQAVILEYTAPYETRIVEVVDGKVEGI